MSKYEGHSDCPGNYAVNLREDYATILAQRDALLRAAKRLLKHMPISWHTDPANAGVRDEVCAAIAQVENPTGEAK